MGRVLGWDGGAGVGGEAGFALGEIGRAVEGLMGWRVKGRF